MSLPGGRSSLSSSQNICTKVCCACGIDYYCFRAGTGLTVTALILTNCYMFCYKNSARRRVLIRSSLCLPQNCSKLDVSVDILIFFYPGILYSHFNPDENPVLSGLVMHHIPGKEAKKRNGRREKKNG